MAMDEGCLSGSGGPNTSLEPTALLWRLARQVGLVIEILGEGVLRGPRGGSACGRWVNGLEGTVA